MFRILYVDNFSQIIGGGQRSLLDLLGKIDKSRFKLLVVLPAEGSLSCEIRKINVGVRIVKMDCLRKLHLFGFLRSVQELKRIIKEENINLVHANGSRAAIYSGIAAKICHIPIIWHVRIADSDGLLDRFLALLSTRIIAISDAVNKRFGWMEERESKVRTIYNGIDLEKFNPSLSKDSIRKELNLAVETPLVGTVGRLDWYKGHKYLLKAARIVVNNIPECRFLIVGDGEKRKSLASLASALKLNRNVIFLGERNDIAQILSGLDLFVLSSVSEGLGRSIIEAMAMGKAVVATNAGGIPEVVKEKETGILVPLKNSKALAEAIIELLKNKDKAISMGMAGKIRVEAIFDLKTNVEKIQCLYLQMLN